MCAENIRSGKIPLTQVKLTEIPWLDYIVAENLIIKPQICKKLIILIMKNGQKTKGLKLCRTSRRSSKLGQSS